MERRFFFFKWRGEEQRKPSYSVEMQPELCCVTVLLWFAFLLPPRCKWTLTHKCLTAECKQDWPAANQFTALLYLGTIKIVYIAEWKKKKHFLRIGITVMHTPINDYHCLSGCCMNLKKPIVMHDISIVSLALRILFFFKQAMSLVC